VHLHAVVRLDGPDGPETAPTAWATAELGAEAVGRAAARVSVTVAGSSGRELVVWWGEHFERLEASGFRESKVPLTEEARAHAFAAAVPAQFTASVGYGRGERSGGDQPSPQSAGDIGAHWPTLPLCRMASGRAGLVTRPPTDLSVLGYYAASGSKLPTRNQGLPIDRGPGRMSLGSLRQSVGCTVAEEDRFRRKRSGDRMKRRSVLLGIWILTALACSSPVPGAATPSDATSGRTSGISITPSAQQTLTQPTTRTETAVPTPTNTLPPSDLPFTIDCTALPESLMARCDTFLAATRDVVYPIERELTGVNLSQCYKEIHYVILPTDPGPNAGGFSSGDTITYNQRYSIDLAHSYDVHEILHSINTCAGALDLHVFHGMIMNAVYDRLGVHDRGYFEDRSAENLNLELENLQTEVKKASGTELTNLCVGILMRRTTIAYFDLGASAITPLYRSTIPPLKNATSPDAKLVEVWGGNAGQIEALRETLQRYYRYTIDVPECGL
jgi:hypothetical protein